MSPAEDLHAGRPRVMSVGGTAAILCPVGHVVTSMPAREWAGSIWEARVGDPTYQVTCSGTH